MEAKWKILRNSLNAPNTRGAKQLYFWQTSLKKLQVCAAGIGPH
jgi:hypothetical protein